MNLRALRGLRLPALIGTGLLLASCADTDGVEVHGSVGMYYGTGGYYNSWYGGGYYPPPVVVGSPGRPYPGGGAGGAARPRPQPLPARTPSMGGGGGRRR